MAKKESNYYSLEHIINLKPQPAYAILYGMRANGKSYAVKKHCLMEAFEKGIKFIYLRRWEKDIKQNYVTAYFDDMPISTLTKGKYSGVQAYQGFLYFTYLDENNKLIRGKEIGRYCALNLNERYKSQAFVGYKYIIFEEFITNQIYLDREDELLLQFTSTILRGKYNSGTCFMIGNTLNRVNPYNRSFGLNILNQKPGTIEIYHHHVGDDVIDVAVEYCQNIKVDNKMFFGNAAKQIISGEWETYEAPRLPKDRSYYYKVIEIAIEYQDFRFIVELLLDENDGTKIAFVYPLTRPRKVKRVLRQEFSPNKFITPRLNLNRRAEAILNDCFRNNKVCYSDNLTAADFKHVYDVFRFGQLY